MRPNDIRLHLRKQPFHPIRIFISDGATYDVRHPEMALVGPTDVVIAVGQGKDGLPERLAYVDPVHVTRIEPINGTKTQRSKKPRTR